MTVLTRVHPNLHALEGTLVIRQIDEFARISIGIAALEFRADERALCVPWIASP
jgi:hypothetical protein